jgi:hypothetical protein
MKKALCIILISLALVACSQTTTEDTTRTTTTSEAINSSYEIPQISILDKTIVWDEIDGAESYGIYVEDVTDIDSDMLLANQYFTQEEAVFDLTNLLNNRIYQIWAKTIVGTESSSHSNSLVVDMFVYTEEQLNYIYNINSLVDFVVYDDTFSTILYMEINGEKVSKSSYYTEYDKLFIDNDYLLAFQNEIIITLFTTSGVINLDITYEDTLVPYMLSNNTINFTGQDIFLVFELCGGQFIEINGSDIDNSNYELSNNILIINSDFIQNLFDESPDRDTIILGYQLKNLDHVVIGYVFIHRTIED